MSALRFLCGATGVALALAFVSPAKADYNLGFGSLPTTQGWQYTTTGNRTHTSESSVYSVSGSVLHEDTFGQPTGSGGFAYYVDYFSPTSTVIDLTRPFELTVNARVTQSDTPGFTFPSAFLFGIILNNQAYEVGLSSASYGVFTAAHPFGYSGSFDNTGYHTYTLDGIAGGKYDFLIDGTVVQGDIVPESYTGLSNHFELGDGTGFSNVVADVHRFSLTQPSSVPEPGSVTMLLSAVLVVAAGCSRCKSKRGG